LPFIVIGIVLSFIGWLMTLVRTKHTP
jgi:hypothetical protein